MIITADMVRNGASTISSAWIVTQLFTLGCYWALLIYQLGAQWSAFEQYNYGWAVPFLCLYLIRLRLRDQVPSFMPVQSRSTTFLLFAIGLLYVPTRLLHEANPVWRLTSWLWALELAGATLCILNLIGGKKCVRRFAFPIGFFLVAVPWPTSVENLVIQNLTRANTAATVEVASWLGIPAIQHGNIIELATGQVGIDEACSGIRSVQGTLMLSLFLGELYRLSIMRRLLILCGGFILAFLFNLVRTSLLTWIVAGQGIAGISSWHDSAGIFILMASFISLWGMCCWLYVRQPSSRTLLAITGLFDSMELSNRSLGFIALGLATWFVLVEIGTETWFRAHEKTPTLSRAWQMNVPRHSRNFQELELSASVREQLKFDSGQSARWSEADGSKWQLFDFVWHPARSVYARAKVNLTKSHNPSICLDASGMKMRSTLVPVLVEITPDLTLVLSRYVFEANGKSVHVFFYSNEAMRSDGNSNYQRMTSWERVKAALAGSRNYGLHTLEIAVWDIEDASAVDDAVRRKLRTMISLPDA